MEYAKVLPLGFLLFSVMTNNLAKEFLDRWKFVDNLTAVETCYQSLVRNPMSILSDVVDDTAILDMRVNPSKSMIMPICFLKPHPFSLTLSPRYFFVFL